MADLSIAALLAGALGCAAGAHHEPAQDRPPDPVRAVVAVFAEEDLQVRVEVARRASLADSEWLALVFENRSAEPLVIEHGHYRIERFRRDVDGSPVRAEGLAWGNSHDLFGGLRGAPRASVAPAGALRVTTHPSDSCASALGRRGIAHGRIEATFHLDLGLSDGRRLATPVEGVVLDLEWLPLDEENLECARARLRCLLATPLRSPPHGYLLGTLLEIPEIASAIQQDELLAALARRSDPFEGREALARHLGQRFPGAQEVREHYLGLIESGPPELLRELSIDGIWDRAFVEPLVRAFERDRRFGLSALDARRGE